jgi:proteasome alpha subunit
VTGRGLANAYAQTLGSIFTENAKPFEVEIVVAEVGATAEADQLYRLTFDGSVADEHGFVAMGGSAERITDRLDDRYQPGLGLTEALAMAVDALGSDTEAEEPRIFTAAQLEVAVLDRTRDRRLFKRITGQRLTDLLPAAP